MNHDLFAPAQSFQRLPLPDAEVLLLRQLALPGSAEDLLQQLIEQIAWRQEQIELWGKRYLQPRLIAWHGDAGRSYRYSGLALEPQPWTLLLPAAERLNRDGHPVQVVPELAYNLATLDAAAELAMNAVTA